MRLHAIVADLDTARAAAAGGATVLQLRLKGVDTGTRVRLGLAMMRLGPALVVNDDVEAALRLGAAGVHLGRDDPGLERALAAGLLVGRSVNTPEEARAAEREGAGYLGAGPVRPTPSKLDTRPAIGIDGLRAICAATVLPVIAVGGIDAGNAAACIRAGADGVAVVRAAGSAAEVLAAMAGARP